MTEIGWTEETAQKGYDLVSALTDDVVTMRRRWHRMKIDYKISPEGIETQALIDDLDDLCDRIENLLPVRT